MGIFFYLFFQNVVAHARLNFQQIEQARTGALNIIAEASRMSPSPGWSVHFRKMYDRLRSARINTPDLNSDYGTCGPSSLAYVNMYVDTSNIYLCRLSLSGSVNKLAQTLVHESAHLAGQPSECDASRSEVLAMRYARAPLQYRNNYLDKCGIVVNARPVIISNAN